MQAQVNQPEFPLRSLRAENTSTTLIFTPPIATAGESFFYTATLD